MKQIIINADDFGLTDGVSKAIVELLKIGAISNTSMMVTIDGVENCAQKYLTPEVSQNIGVHLTTTPENHHRHPISNPKNIKSLVNEEGLFKEKNHEDWINPDEIEYEWDLQIQKAIDILGHRPSHLDSHHGVHRKDNLIPIYLELAKKYKIPVRGGVIIGQIDGTLHHVKNTFICNSDWTGQNQSANDLQKVILSHFDVFPDQGTLEICTHPGFCDDELIKSSSWNINRENDYSQLLKLHTTGWLNDNNIELIRFNDL